jgi:hypothetical protein
MKPRIRYCWKHKAWVPTSGIFAPYAQLEACLILNLRICGLDPAEFMYSPHEIQAMHPDYQASRDQSEIINERARYVLETDHDPRH